MAHGVAMGLLVLMFALLVLGARQNSITADEPAYIAGGYAVLVRGQEALPMLAQRGYPPLLAILEALPIYLATPEIPVEQVPGWPADYDTFTQAFKPYLAPWERTEAAARMITICLVVVLGAVVWRWGVDLWGPLAGLIALGIMTLDPTMLAHGRLAHTDAGSTALGTAALFVAWRWYRKPSWRSAVFAGLLLAFTLLAKVSGALWLVVAGLIVLGTLVERREEGHTFKLAAQGALMMAVAGLVWWAAYGLDWGRSSAFPIDVPAPVYWDGLQYLRNYTTDVFALGLYKSTHGGWPWYFPLAFLIKNPLPVLIALGIALVMLLRQANRFRPTDIIALAAFPLLYSAVAIVEGTAIGYRHMLPVHPFIYLVVGGGLTLWAGGASGKPWRRWVVVGLGLWLVVGAVCAFPWEISFFNELVGGSAGGYRYLADSNVDWGQADRVRDAYLEAHPGTEAKRPDAGFNPAPGRYLVGASALQGVGATGQYAYEWFRHRAPQEMLAGGSQLVFDGPVERPQWLVQCSRPVAPLTSAAIAEGTGQFDLRTVDVDCGQTWIYPAGGETPGIYALHHELLVPRRLCLPALLPCPTRALDPFLERHLTGAHLSYEQPNDGDLPAFALFEREAHPVGGAASSEVALAGPLAFLGAAGYRTGDGLEVETTWRVVDGPIERPFSIMGHLLDEQGTAISLADGSGLSPLALQQGDVIVQRHRFPDAQGNSVRFETGAYWLDDLSRWPLAGRAGDSIVLPLQVVSRDGRNNGGGGG